LRRNPSFSLFNFRDNSSCRIASSKKGTVVYAHYFSNTFINDAEDKLLLMMLKIKMSLRAKRGNLIKKEFISTMTSFHSKRLPRFARNDIQKELPNYRAHTTIPVFLNKRTERDSSLFLKIGIFFRFDSFHLNRLKEAIFR